MEQWNSGMEWWNGGIMEWPTMTNDPVHTNLFACVHYVAQLEQSTESDVNRGRGERARDVDREAKAIEHTTDSAAIDLDLLLLPAQTKYLPLSSMVPV